MSSFRRFFVLFVLSCSAFALSQPSALAAEGQSSSEKEKKLIAILQSDAPPQEKAIPCKQLAIYGTRDAVPALAPLLLNPDLASWARIALEAIPDPAADEALRKAMKEAKGRLLVGVINSIGVRRDAKAVDGLVENLADADVAVASAAADVLGKIGGEKAASTLEKFLATGPTEVRPAAAYGCVMCAEKFLADGKQAEAIRLYDTLRKASLPKQRILEATRGAILARQTEGVPLLLEQLRSSDKAFLNLGMGVVREMPGREVTQMLISEIDTASLDRQILFVQAIADRTDSAVMPKVIQLAEKGPKQLRITAIGLLDRFGDNTDVLPVLLTAAADNDGEVSNSAKAAFARLEGKSVDGALLARLPESNGKMRQTLIEIAGKRRINGALPEIMKSVQDSDAGVRQVALATVGVMGQPAQADDLARLLPKAQNADEREEIEKALISICNRGGTKCLPQVQALAGSGDSNIRRVGLRASSSIGGAEALALVKNALNDPDEAVQDEAVSTLSNWPNNWPEDSGVAEPLLTLAKSGKKTSHQVQGLRGYLQYLQEDKKMKSADKLAGINELLPSIKRPEEKRLTIAAISNLPGADMLNPLMSLAEDPAVSEEASMAIVKIATAKEQKNAPKELRRKALQTALEKSKNDATRKKAEEALKALM